jgi:hypothetical protein
MEPENPDEDERFEQVIAFVGSQLPAPVEQQEASDGTLLFVGGSPAEVIVHLDDTSVVVSEYAGVWETPDRFVVKPRRVGLLKWRRLPETALMNALGALIKGARDTRLARFRPCRVCEQSFPPEMLAVDICPTCRQQRQRPPVVH